MEFKSVDSFLNYLKVIKDYSSDTIGGYESDLKLFFNYLNENKINIKCENDITLQDMYDFLGYCINERGNSARTNNRRVACLKSYWKYLLKKAKLVEENIAEELETSKIHFRNQNYINAEQVKVLINTLDDWDCNFYRDKMCLLLFCNLALRLSELTNIKMSDIDYNKKTIKILGKGSKERILFLSDSLIKVIQDYINVERKGDSEYLILSKRRTQVSNQTIQAMVKKRLKEANLDGIIHKVHSLRRSGATIMYENGADIRTIQTILNHSSLNTTMLYVSTNESVIKDTMINSPLANII